MVLILRILKDRKKRTDKMNPAHNLRNLMMAITTRIRSCGRASETGYFWPRNAAYSFGWSLAFGSLLMMAFTSPCFAIPTQIPVISGILTDVVPYATFAFSAGGVYYSAVNAKMVVNGDYKRVIPAVIALLGTTMGIAGLFGATVLTVTVG